MTDLTLRCDVTGDTTVLTVLGSVEAHRCRILREGLELAHTMRAAGPIVVDLSGVHAMTLPALLILRRAAEDARRSGRTLTVQHLRKSIIDPSPTTRLGRAVWSAVCCDGPTGVAGRAGLAARTQRPGRTGRRGRPTVTISVASGR